MSQAVATALVGGALLVVSGALLWHLTRGTTLWFDEWQWALNRRGGDLGTYLRPHNEHLSLVPIAIYKALFVTAGLEHYGPYRALVIAGHLACVSLVFVYARRRVGDVAAVVAASLLLFLGRPRGAALRDGAPSAREHPRCSAEPAAPAPRPRAAAWHARLAPARRASVCGLR